MISGMVITSKQVGTKDASLPWGMKSDPVLGNVKNVRGRGQVLHWKGSTLNFSRLWSLWGRGPLQEYI